MPPGRAKKAVAKNKANAYKMPAPIPTGEVIHDPIGKKKWRIGPSIGVGGFGEIYSACEDNSPKKRTEYPFVIKIEPHENGPLFVEKHFYIRNANKDDITKYMKTMNLSSLGMPTYFGNGSHVYKDEKYRYLVLERYGRDLWSIFKEAGRSFPPATVFIIGLQMLDVLEYIHSRGYVHADVKGANILLGLKKGTENQTYLVDFGLATRLNDKEFKPDPKCAHNGTIEYTSRDAHLGVATMRGDLEILGYNMLQWLVGELPWENSLKSPKVVQNKKESFMNNVRSNITSQYSDVPDALIKFMEYVSTMKPNDKPDYSKCRKLFEGYLKSEGKTRNSKLEFGATKKVSSKRAIVDDSDETDGQQNGDKKSKAKRPGKEAKDKKDAKVNGEIKSKAKKVDKEDKDDENKAKRNNKRQSTETAAVLEIKRAKLSPMATPPAKKNHANISTQTSLEKPRRSGRLALHSPVGDVDETPQTSEASANSSGDIFDDSFKIEDKKIKKKRKLVTDEKVTVKRVVRTTVTAAKKGKSWKDCPAVVNGRPPAK